MTMTTPKKTSGTIDPFNEIEGELVVMPPALDMPVDLGRIQYYVAEKHKDQRRKDGTAYVLHLREVANYAKSIASDLDLSEAGQAACAAAGYLHDIIEDQGVDFEDVVAVSSLEVACYVSWLTDDKRLPSQLRHHIYAKRLGHERCPQRVQIVKLADLYDNSESALRHLHSENQLKDAMARWWSKAVYLTTAIKQVRRVRHYGLLRHNLDEIGRLLE